MDTQDVQVKIHFKEKFTPPFGYCDFEEPKKNNNPPPQALFGSKVIVCESCSFFRHKQWVSMKLFIPHHCLSEHYFSPWLWNSEVTELIKGSPLNHTKTKTVHENQKIKSADRSNTTGPKSLEKAILELYLWRGWCWKPVSYWPLWKKVWSRTMTLNVFCQHHQLNDCTHCCRLTAFQFCL